MKKKLMMVTALMGLISFSACVDNNETQSVTNVRDAKAEQYQARADMNNAEAQAIQIMANADAALLNAKAKAAQANAAKAEAEAATILKKKELVELQKAAATLENEAAQIENQKAQAALEEALSDLEVTKADAEKELARIAAQLEADRLKWQADLLQAEKNLLTAQQELQDELDNDPTAAEELQALVTAYSTAVSNLVAAQQELAGAKADLVALEENLTNYPQYKAERTEALNASIKQYEARIAKYKEYSNYTEEDLAPMKLKLAELDAQYDKLGDDYNVASDLLWDEYYKANDDKNINPENVINAAYAELYNTPLYSLGNNGRLTILDKEGEEVVYNLYSNYNIYGSLYSLNSIAYVWNINLPINYDKKDIQFVKDDYQRTFSLVSVDSLSLGECELPVDVRQVELNADGMISEIGAAIKTAADEQAAWKAQYDGKATKAYDEGLNEISDWTPTRNAVDSTKYEYDLWQKALADDKVEQQVKDSLENTYKNALNIELALKNQIDSYDGELEKATNFLAAAKAYAAVFQNWDQHVAEVQEAIDSLNEVAEEFWSPLVEAWMAEREIECERLNVEIERDAINTFLNGGNGQTGANNLQNSIATYEEKIESYKKDIEELDNIESMEQAIEYAKASVAAKEAVVAARQVAVNEAKAALDEAMPATAE